MKKRIVLGVTLGDAGGIGPEVVLKSIHRKRWPSHLRFVIIGARHVIERESARLSLPSARPWEPGCSIADRVSTWDPAAGRPFAVRPGRTSVAASRAAAAWISEAVRLCMSGAISGMVTAPISKEGFHRAGIRVAGHTELLERLTGTPESAMFLVGGGLRVVPVTRHVPLSTVPRLVTADRIVSQGVLANRALGWLRVPGRRLAVCGLNPHAGEGGKIGTEEARSIVPAVRRLRCLGVKADGPVPADSAFARCLAGEYAGVLAMYHDQGLGPLKTVAFDSGVNITVGLPIVRTSPCHGTAFEIAGKNRADSASMISAIATACELASRPNPFGR